MPLSSHLQIPSPFLCPTAALNYWSDRKIELIFAPLTLQRVSDPFKHLPRRMTSVCSSSQPQLAQVTSTKRGKERSCADSPLHHSAAVLAGSTAQRLSLHPACRKNNPHRQLRLPTGYCSLILWSDPKIASLGNLAKKQLWYGLITSTVACHGSENRQNVQSALHKDKYFSNYKEAYRHLLYWNNKTCTCSISNRLKTTITWPISSLAREQ